jgi:hypothetical protein
MSDVGEKRYREDGESDEDDYGDGDGMPPPKRREAPSVVARVSAARRANACAEDEAVRLGLAHSEEALDDAEANGDDIGTPPRRSMMDRPTAGERDIFAVIGRAPTNEDKMRKLQAKRRDIPFPAVSAPSYQKMVDDCAEEEARVAEEHGEDRECPACSFDEASFLVTDETSFDITTTFHKTMDKGDIYRASRATCTKYNREVVGPANETLANMPAAERAKRAPIKPWTAMDVYRHFTEHVTTNLTLYCRRALAVNNEAGNNHLHHGLHRISASDPLGPTYTANEDFKIRDQLSTEALKLFKALGRSSETSHAATPDEMENLLTTASFPTYNFHHASKDPYLGYAM